YLVGVFPRPRGQPHRGLHPDAVARDPTLPVRRRLRPERRGAEGSDAARCAKARWLHHDRGLGRQLCQAVRGGSRQVAASRFAGRWAVPTYVMLANWTDQGARQVQESPKRLDAAKKLLVEMGGK